MNSGSKLGRNPFQKPGRSVKIMPVAEHVMRHAVPEESKPVDPGSVASDKTEVPAALGAALAQLVLVDLPANAVVLGLKVFLLARETFSKKER